MRKKLNLKNREYSSIYNLFNGYVLNGNTWTDNLKFQLFILKNKRILKDVMEDLSELKKGFPEYLEYEEKARELILLKGKEPELELEKLVKKLEEDYKDVEDIKKVVDLFEEVQEVDLEVIKETELPSGLSAAELEIFYELIDMDS